MKNLLSDTKAIKMRIQAALHANPDRDWLALVMLSVIAFSGLVVWNIWAFDQVAAGGTLGITPPEAPAVLGQASLEAVHAEFADRAAEQEKYLSGAYTFADPSQ